MPYDPIPDEFDPTEDEPRGNTLLNFLLTHRPCPVCHADGRVLDGGVWCTCQACQGSGYAHIPLVQRQEAPT